MVQRYIASQLAAKLLFLASTVAVATCGTKEARPMQRLDLVGVDPNTLSCDPQGQVFLLLPHFTDCNKFFMCVHGEEVEFSCSGNTIFDFVLQTCNWDWATECVLRTPKEDSIEEEGSGDVTLDFAEFEESAAAIELVKPSPFGFGVVNCASAATASRQAAYRGDCQRFWRCVDGVPQASFCSDGLFFNPKSEQCDFEANVQCLVDVEELKEGFLVD
ncbi:hypothetical protein EVAR_14750_1 [Eumeta japonica]|uniref:Chitin-binding type-2 domain-containing protein n=1 Tax=Eumeta variegata TaxID=151549 RepID=A0A4C1TWG3_EUMVA|nr:hypothetical protein EVAR_14750_1 [Eumeta japonica]